MKPLCLLWGSWSLLTQSASSRKRTCSCGNLGFYLFIITAYSCWVSLIVFETEQRAQCCQLGHANKLSPNCWRMHWLRWGAAFNPPLCNSEWEIWVSLSETLISSVSTNLWGLVSLQAHCRLHLSKVHLQSLSKAICHLLDEISGVVTWKEFESFGIPLGVTSPMTWAGFDPALCLSTHNPVLLCSSTIAPNRHYETTRRRVCLLC